MGRASHQPGYRGDGKGLGRKEESPAVRLLANLLFVTAFLILSSPSHLPLPSLPFPFPTLQILPSISPSHCTLLLPHLPRMALSESQPLRQCHNNIPHLPLQGR